MSTELTRKNVPAPRLVRRNTMAFPHELRQAIPKAKPETQPKNTIVFKLSGFRL
jgi:hypothetical protein